MDIRREGWFGQLEINGKRIQISDNRNTLATGSIMRLVGDSLKALQEQRARSGDCLIKLTFSTRQITDTLQQEQVRANEVDSLLNRVAADNEPHHNESYEDYYTRLITKIGLLHPSAQMLADAWFDREPDPQLTQWINDPEAIRFRELNSRDEAYESALPNEYETLKRDMIQRFPSFCEHLTFRTA
jgi:hypothetical protein